MKTDIDEVRLTLYLHSLYLDGLRSGQRKILADVGAIGRAAVLLQRLLVEKEKTPG